MSHLYYYSVSWNRLTIPMNWKTRNHFVIRMTSHLKIEIQNCFPIVLVLVELLDLMLVAQMELVMELAQNMFHLHMYSTPPLDKGHLFLVGPTHKHYNSDRTLRTTNNHREKRPSIRKHLHRDHHSPLSGPQSDQSLQYPLLPRSDSKQCWQYSHYSRRSRQSFRRTLAY